MERKKLDWNTMHINSNIKLVFLNPFILKKKIVGAIPVLKCVLLGDKLDRNRS